MVGYIPGVSTSFSLTAVAVTMKEPVIASAVAMVRVTFSPSVTIRITGSSGVTRIAGGKSVVRHFFLDTVRMSYLHLL